MKPKHGIVNYDNLIALVMTPVGFTVNILKKRYIGFT